MNSYSLINNVLLSVIQKGSSLQTLFPLKTSIKVQEEAKIKAICYGVLRQYWQLQNQLSPYLQKPLKNKDIDIKLYLMVALFQIQNKPQSAFAIVDETVKAIKKGKKRWASGLANAVLRQHLRQPKKPASDLQSQYELPLWLIERLQKDWPQDFEQVADQSNQHPPMTIRVNRQQGSVAEYQKALREKGIESEAIEGVESALKLTRPVDVSDLPGFDEGACSVQDGAAQLAARFLDIHPQQVILDACAAPGGKTGHILEFEPKNEVVAADVDEKRLTRVRQNLQRIDLEAEVVETDLSNTECFESDHFDRILLDAPCSALGVVRRHPDIKYLRKASDIEPLVSLQSKILQNCWQWLKPGGKLLYATCSILKDENEKQIDAFLAAQPNATLLPLVFADIQHSHTGLQILPGEHGLDGFYFALLQKSR